jgi:subtilisin family serine protease
MRPGIFFSASLDEISGKNDSHAKTQRRKWDIHPGTCFRVRGLVLLVIRRTPSYLPVVLPQSSPTDTAPMYHTRLCSLGALTALLWALTAVLPSSSCPVPVPVPVADEAETATSSSARPREQILTKMGVDRWQAAGTRGRGVKVAIIDTGFRGWRDHLGKALPAHVTAHSFRADGNLEFKDSQHGILCGEVVHTLAPDAELLFANWDPGHEDQFLAAIRWAREQGAHVVSISVITPSWSDGEGGGTMHRALSDLLGPGTKSADVLCFASAGNTTDRHWNGHFKDGGDGWHCWHDKSTDNGLRPWGEDDVYVELYGKASGTYELDVVDSDTGREVGKAATNPRQTDRLSAAVRFKPNVAHSYSVRVRHVAGTAGDFHVTTTFGSLGSTTPGANVCFPADGKEVVALGAVDQDGHRQDYSACGTNLARVKPDLVAVVPFPTSFRTRPFGGTSAAAPQAAALAALCWSRHPGWTATHVREAMQSAAIDLNTPGPDCETGYGLIHVPAE